MFGNSSLKYVNFRFEEPVVPEDIDGYRRVQSKTYIPIAGGECSFMRYGFRDLFVGNVMYNVV